MVWLWRWNANGIIDFSWALAVSKELLLSEEKSFSAFQELTKSVPISHLDHAFLEVYVWLWKAFIYWKITECSAFHTLKLRALLWRQVIYFSLHKASRVLNHILHIDCERLQNQTTSKFPHQCSCWRWTCHIMEIAAHKGQLPITPFVKMWEKLQRRSESRRFPSNELSGP